MVHSRIANGTAVPWWAAFGAPLVGVPLLVGLLALGSGGDASVGAGEDVEAGYVTERSEALQAAVELPPGSTEASADARG